MAELVTSRPVILPFGVVVRLAGCMRIQLHNNMNRHTHHHVRYSEHGIMEDKWANLNAWYSMGNQELIKEKAVIYFYNTSSFQNAVLSVSNLGFDPNCKIFIDFEGEDGEFPDLPDELDVDNNDKLEIVINNGKECASTANTPPVITLLGDNPQIVLFTINEYTELGATAVDSEDGDLTDSIVIDTSDFDDPTKALYTVSYTVTDSGGLSSTVVRTVQIEARA